MMTQTGFSIMSKTAPYALFKFRAFISDHFYEIIARISALASKMGQIKKIKAFLN